VRDSFWIIVDNGGVSRVVSLSRQCILMNTSVHSCIILFAGQQIAMGCFLQPGEPAVSQW
jgi:hypothetical protein